MLFTRAQLLRDLTPDETAADLIGRLATEAVLTGIPCVDARVKLRPGHVLELAGPTGAAKSDLLAQIAVNFITTAPPPPTHENDGDGGGQPTTAAAAAAPPPQQQQADSLVMLIDLDGKFDMVRVAQLLQARGVALSSDAAHAALSRLVVARVRSSAQLLVLLATLPQRLKQLKGKVSLLLLDNVGAFAWQDRASRPPPDLAAAAGAGGGGGPPPYAPSALAAVAAAGAGAGVGALGPPLTLQRVHTAAAAMLRAAAARARLAVIATKSAAVGWATGDGGAPRLAQREHLPQAWQRAVTHRLLLLPGRPVVAQGGPALTRVTAQLQAAAAGAAAGRDGPVVELLIGDAGLVAQRAASVAACAGAEGEG